MKRLALVWLILALALPLSGCGRSEEAKRLDHFKREWAGTFVVFPGFYFVKTIVNQPDSNTIAFGFSITESSPGSFRQVHGDRLIADSKSTGTPTLASSFNLRYDSSQKKYFLNAQIGPKLLIKDLPLSYSDTEGYVGKGTTTVGMQVVSVEVKIEDHMEASDWTISFAASDWNERFLLMLSSGPTKGAFPTTPSK